MSTVAPFKPDIKHPDASRPSIIVSARMADTLAVAIRTADEPRRRGGCDSAMVIARRWLITALESALSGHEWVYAHPRRIAELFAQHAHPRLKDGVRPKMDTARPGYRLRDQAGALVAGHEAYTPRLGMSERTLAAHQAEFLRYACTDLSRRGRYRLHRDRRFYALPFEVVWTLAYCATNPELRTALAHLAPLAAAVNDRKPVVKAPARRAHRRTGQGLRRFCSAMKGLRMLGLLVDNRPRRHYSPTRKRYPCRRILVAATALAPLPKARIRWSTRATTSSVPGRPDSDSGVVRPAIWGTEPFGPSKLERETHPGQAGGGQEERAATQEPAATPPAPAPQLDQTHSDGARPEPCETSAAEPRGRPAAPDDGQRLTLATTRQTLARHGIETRDRATLAVLAAVLVTARDLDRVLELEADELREVAHPARWLAAIAKADGPAMRSPDWPGSKRRRRAELERRAPKVLETPEETRRREALERLVREAAGDVDRIRRAADAWQEAGETHLAAEASRTADQLRQWAAETAEIQAWTAAYERGRAISSAWQGWQTAIACLAEGDSLARRLSRSVVVAYDDATACVLTLDDDDTRYALAGPHAQRLANELAAATGVPRALKYVRADGTCLGTVYPARAHFPAARPTAVREEDRPPVGPIPTTRQELDQRAALVAKLEGLAPSSPSARRLLASMGPRRSAETSA